jgi:hypothetical protein
LDIPANFQFDADEMNLRLKPDGRMIKCTKSDASPKVNFWHAECDGGGSANFLKGGKNDRGKDMIYGSVVDKDEICLWAPNADGENESTCIPLSDFPDEADPFHDDESLGSAEYPFLNRDLLRREQGGAPGK